MRSETSALGVRKKVLTAVLLTASIFGFGNYTNASGDPGYTDYYGYMTPVSNAFPNTSFVSYAFAEESLYIDNNYPNLKNKIDNILKKVEYKLRNKTNQQKIQFYERLSKKVSEIGNRLTVKNLNYFILVKIKFELYLKISTLKDNNSNVLNNLFGDIEVNSNNNINYNYSNNTYNTNKTQTYKIYGAPLSYNLSTDKSTLTKIKLGMFNVSTSNGQEVRINNFGIKIFNSKGGKIPSIKYLKLYTAAGDFVRNLEFISNNGYTAKFNISGIDLYGKYTIIGDVSDIVDGQTILKIQFDHSYSSSNLVNKQIDFGKVNIKK